MKEWVRPATPDDRETLDGLHREYLFELAKFGDGIDTDQKLQDEWFAGIPDLHPYIMWKDGAAVGFQLVLGGAYAAAVSERTDFYLFDCYVVEGLRGTGLAEEAVKEVFGSLPGRWGLSFLERNVRAHAFWVRVLQAYGDSLEAGKDQDGHPSFYFRTA